MKKAKMSPPWYGFSNQIKALFGKDPDISIVEDFESGDPLILKLFVSDSDKAQAIENLLPDKVNFGGTELSIWVVPGNRTRTPSSELYKKAFEGNPAVRAIKTVEGVFTNPITYVSFEKEVIQYYDDNLGDLHGNRSMLLEDIARDIFEDNNKEGIMFCTDNE